MKQATRMGLNHHMDGADRPLRPAQMRADAAPALVSLPEPHRLTPLGRSAVRAAPQRLRGALSQAASRERDCGLAFLFLPVAMGGGAGLFYMSPTDPDLFIVGAGMLIALLLAALSRQNHIAAARCATFLAALLAGALAAGIEQQRGAVLLDSDVTTRIDGRVDAREFDGQGRVWYLIDLVSTADPEIRRPPARVRVVARAPHQPVPVGALISGRARLSSPSGPVMPGGYDFAFKAFVDGIGAHGFFYSTPETAAPTLRQTGLVHLLKLRLRTVREQISMRIRTVLPGDPGGVAAALAVSDRRGISKATQDALRATGLAHILAISGLHMALAAGTLYIGLRKGLALFPTLVEAFPVKKIAAIGALLTATAYLLISGGSVATQRAWVMLAVMLIAVLADRSALTMRNVALSAIVIIVLTPSAVVGPGFQMSFAATAALIAAYAVFAGRARDRPVSAPGLLGGSMPVRWFVALARLMLGLAITSLVAGVATGLFSAHHFHRVAGHGLLANLLAMPLVTLVVMPAGLAAMLLMPFGLDAMPLQLMGRGIEGVIAMANYVDSLGGNITVGQIPLAATATAGAGLVFLVFLRSWLHLSGAVLIALGIALALPPLARPGPDILISEDGKLVALVGPETLASNAARPSAFVFEQWQAALRSPPHLPPANYPQAAADDVEKVKLLDGLLAAAVGAPSRFHCAGRGICAAMHHQARLIAINQAALIGAACDRADVVVVAIPVHMRTCRSGAVLVTSRSLRRSGAMTLTILARPSAAAEDQSEDLSGGGRVGKTMKRPEFRIRTALQGIVRPWTIQRYYDWRTRSYDLPD
ncbi:ComEC/Rec2-related protein [Hoeflea sp. IMCC20628]|uniref:ComEC/Rec2 family competence protein n=1 Tax=Hoeflea sp. IMCC20628 TaxID=1620421 RepID=UPI00063AADF3|nr:ComEC/Rec2 family competence protein [Hoeflea sp. IMCC20628]AKI00824.1 ComEC/Rec2-related protein [Hoeflea sp. IMCC20628]